MEKGITDFDQLFPSNYIKAGELGGKAVTLTIKDWSREEMKEQDGKKKKKPILSFVETEKQVVLNKTNGLCLKKMFGRAVAEWVGKRITIHPAPYQDGLCIRIKGSPDIDRDITWTERVGTTDKTFTMEKTTKRAASKDAEVAA